MAFHRPSGRLTEAVIDDRGGEFPRINGRYGPGRMTSSAEDEGWVLSYVYEPARFSAA